ncbi:Protein-tyrosine-phosphatase [Halopenitus persicus]|uniref:Protein-tyrosine-phosphatase n=2 Tax=Halopenitus persicus TaxID=1048396 RepID=A0A1H3MRS9_9EURY|nr:Protein-tyrosine-phosphatase [Halopenitus persicus]
MPTHPDSTDRTTASNGTTDSAAGTGATGTTDAAETDAAETDSIETDAADTIRVAFMCVRNAGRSQMATAFAERERDRRGLTDRVEIVTGGTRPADRVHEAVVEVMTEVDVDLADRTPREITIAELRSCDYVATMGCSTLDVGELGADADVDVRDWALPDPDGKDLDRVREIREDIAGRVDDLFKELVDTMDANAGDPADPSSPDADAA